MSTEVGGKEFSMGAGGQESMMEVDCWELLTRVWRWDLNIFLICVSNLKRQLNETERPLHVLIFFTLNINLNEFIISVKIINELYYIVNCLK